MTSSSGPCPDFLSGCFSCLGGPSFQNVPDTPGPSPKSTKKSVPQPIYEPVVRSDEGLRKRVTSSEKIAPANSPTPRPRAAQEIPVGSIYTAPEAAEVKEPERRKSVQQLLEKTHQIAETYLYRCSGCKRTFKQAHNAERHFFCEGGALSIDRLPR